MEIDNKDVKKRKILASGVAEYIDNYGGWGADLTLTSGKIAADIYSGFETDDEPYFQSIQIRVNGIVRASMKSTDEKPPIYFAAEAKSSVTYAAECISTVVKPPQKRN